MRLRKIERQDNNGKIMEINFIDKNYKQYGYTQWCLGDYYKGKFYFKNNITMGYEFWKGEKHYHI